MRFVNTVELKNRLNAVLADVARGDVVFVTRRGKPAVAVVSATEETFDQLVFERSSAVRRAVSEGLADLRAGRRISAAAYARRRFGTAKVAAKNGGGRR